MAGGSQKLRDQEAAGNPPPIARRVRITSCTDAACGCGAVYLELLDDADAIIAVAPFSAEGARGLAEQLRAAALKQLGGLQ